MKRGQGTTMSLEEFVKLAMSVFLAGILLTIIASIYLWWASPDLKSDATAKNELENLAGLINAQESETWELYTFVALTQDMAIISFNEGDKEKTLSSDYFVDLFTEDIVLQKPSSCTTCLCVVSDRIISCEDFGSQVSFVSQGMKPSDECLRYRVAQTKEQLLVTQDAQSIIEISNACN